MPPLFRRISRREWLGAGITLGLASLAQAEDGKTTKGDGPPAVGRVREASRDIPLIHDADVIVCGAGPAGVSAAITAARAGAKVRLFETHGARGGVWTSSLLGLTQTVSADAWYSMM